MKQSIQRQNGRFCLVPGKLGTGKPLVDGAEAILHNKKFLDAAKAAFGTSRAYPEFIVVNATPISLITFPEAVRQRKCLPRLPDSQLSTSPSFRQKSPPRATFLRAPGCPPATAG